MHPRQDTACPHPGSGAGFSGPILPAVLAFLFVSLALLGEARAIPAFARKYRTSCQTCHVPFPKLNAFGEAFRRNGYRFPGGEDEEASEDEPVPLGQEAHKEVFPDEVWPARLPSVIPMAVILAGRVDIDPAPDAEQDPELSFAGLAGSLGLAFASTLGDTFSAWAGAAIRASTGGGAEADLERAFVVIKPFAEPVLNFRVGRFEPGLMGFTMHRTLGLAPWILTTSVQDNSFTPDPVQLGFEATGVTGAGRLTYAVGVVEGGGDRINAEKDVYSRLAYKIGGARADGVGGAEYDLPYRELSLNVGGFGHFGIAALGDPATASQEDTFFLAGGDLQAQLLDLTLLGAFAYGRNSTPSLSRPDRDAKSYHVFGQLDYVVFPWLIPTARYERRSVAEQTGDRVSAGVYALWRANIRSQVLASVERANTEPFEPGKVMLGLNLAY